MRLCQYQNLLGRPRTGLHSYRIFDLAIVDIILSLLAAGWLQRWVFPKQTYGQVLVGVLLLGVFLHWLFCVPTTVNLWFGLA